MSTFAEENYEAQILDVAERLFLQKGYAMTSTTDIAKEVGCNQSLVHYYFRTKEKLFMQIFIEKGRVFLSVFTDIDDENTDFFTMVRHKIEAHFDLLMNNQEVPFLLINELITNRTHLKSMIEAVIKNSQVVDTYNGFSRQIAREVEKGTIRKIAAVDLIINIVSLNVFTFITLPITKELFEMDKEMTDSYIAKRKDEIVCTILNSIKA